MIELLFKNLGLYGFELFFLLHIFSNPKIVPIPKISEAMEWEIAIPSGRITGTVLMEEICSTMAILALVEATVTMEETTTSIQVKLYEPQLRRFN